MTGPDRRTPGVDILAAHEAAWTATDPTTDAGVTGAALWVPYGQPAMSDERAECFAAESVALAGPYGDRMLEIFTLLDGQHPQEPHEYLWFLGVRPTAQGRGIGSALLAAALRRADAAGHPCYLEATSPGNRELYRRHGFRSIAEIAVAMGPRCGRCGATRGSRGSMIVEKGAGGAPASLRIHKRRSCRRGRSSGSPAAMRHRR